MRGSGTVEDRGAEPLLSVVEVWSTHGVSSANDFRVVALCATRERALAVVEDEKNYIERYHGPHYPPGPWTLGLDDEWQSERYGERIELRDREVLT